MLTANETGTVYVSSLLEQQAPQVNRELTAILSEYNIPLHYLHGTNDVWCRDFMPVWVSRDECVQFVFDPKYYKPKKYRNLRTEPIFITPRLGLSPYFCGMVLDGGNIVNNKDTAIVTERIFDDNPKWDEKLLITTLRDFLQVGRVIVVPQLTGDRTGHIDGMVRFIDRRRVLLNDLTYLVAPKLYRHIKTALFNAGLEVIVVPNELHLNTSFDDATGDYINFLEVRNLVAMPSYGWPMDEEVYRLYRELFPTRSVVQVDISELAPLGGGLNCATWCIPGH